MYIINKLEAMSMLFGHENIDGELSTYFMVHLSQLSHMTLQKCLKETGVSKASIHRFYSKAGFTSFKSFIRVLQRESKNFDQTDFDSKNYERRIVSYLHDDSFYNKQVSSLIRDLLKSERVYFYGNQVEIGHLVHLKKFLRKSGKQVLSLNMWSIQSAYEQIKQLDHNDIFIIVDASIRIQNLYETSINNAYLLNLNLIKDLNFKKYYIGETNTDEYMSFNNIRIPNYGEDLMYIGIILLDRYICEKLKERENE